MMNPFFYRKASHSFCDIEWYGYRRSLYLVRKTELFGLRKILRETVNINHQLLGKMVNV